MAVPRKWRRVKGWFMKWDPMSTRAEAGFQGALCSMSNPAYPVGMMRRPFQKAQAPG